MFEVNEHFFKVDRGKRFYLKLDMYGIPGPINVDYEVTLTRNKKEEMRGVASTALIYDIDSVDIQIASEQHQDTYEITASTCAGECSLKFTLYVEGTYVCALLYIVAKNSQQKKILPNL